MEHINDGEDNKLIKEAVLETVAKENLSEEKFNETANVDVDSIALKEKSS
jgi:hypothetical protein